MEIQSIENGSMIMALKTIPIIYLILIQFWPKTNYTFFIRTYYVWTKQKFLRAKKFVHIKKIEKFKF